MNKKIRDHNIKIGNIKTGKNNSITDVKGLKVGHKTLDDGNIKTGVTVIIPKENMFKEKLLAASYVINGFGKSIGLVQIDEVGTIETPIILTNTFSVPAASDALIRYMLKSNEDIGDTTGTVNPVVGECNDGRINDIRALAVTQDHIYEAFENAATEFAQGDVGAGKGMMCYGLKGGIGSSSRVINLGKEEYTIGVLVLSNFGILQNLLIDGKNIGKEISDKIETIKDKKDQGSIILILATDIPLSSRQLKRVIKRVQPGISRTGSYTGNGSGEIVIGFSTANTIKHYEEEDIVNIAIVNENKIDDIFKAVVEATEEAIVNSLVCSNSSITRKGEKVYSLKDFL